MRRLLVILMCFAVAAPYFSYAAEQQSAELSITPVVIDEKGKPRDIVKQTITIVNTSERKLQLYPSVNNVDVADGKQEFTNAVDSSDRSASLANWIELSRGVLELGPGEEKVIPFVIRVNMNAVPGSYHAKIAFGDGSSRSAAEGNTLAAIVVNLEVLADVHEVMQLNKFSTGNLFFSGDDVLFNYQLENIGNQELKPHGEIRIYNRRGEEVASVAVNEEGKSFSPDQVSQLASVWSASDGFGRFKAFLTVDYGQGQGASVQDTVFFWIIPWKQILALSIVSLIGVIFFALYFHKWFEHRHIAKLAGAGLLKHPAHVTAEAATHGVHAGSSGFSVGGVLSLAASPFMLVARVMPHFIPRISFGGAKVAVEDEEDVDIVEDEPAEEEPQATERQGRASLRDAFEQEGGRAPVREAPAFVDAQWGVIDLKKRQKVRDDDEPSHGHVINLKKR